MRSYNVKGEELFKRGIYGALAIVLLLIPVLTKLNLESAKAQSPPIMSISPSRIVVSVGQVFEVNIMIEELNAASEMVTYACMIYGDYDFVFDFSQELELLDIKEGPFMKQFPTPPNTPESGTYFEVKFVHEYITPFIMVGCILIPNQARNWTVFPEGSGVVVVITLKAKAIGNFTLDLINSWMTDRNGEEILHSRTDSHLEVREPLLGDLNLDSMVDMQDIGIAACAFGSYPSHPRWNADADINKDDTVNMRDIALIARNFGEEYQL